MTEIISGQFTGDYSNKRGGFTYWYTCSVCRKRFIETTPEITAPALCNMCFTGQHRINENIRNKLKMKDDKNHDTS